MTAPRIEVITLVNGTKASQLTDENLFNHIAGVEKAIEQLEKIQTKSAKLDEHIADLREQAKHLAELVDTREESEDAYGYMPK